MKPRNNYDNERLKLDVNKFSHEINYFRDLKLNLIFLKFGIKLLVKKSCVFN